MKLGIMQPYFFPYAQQFRHIAQCDRWVIFDTVKYSRKTWENRNRVADRNSDWSYISVPVKKGASKGRMVEAELGDIDWRKALFDKLRTYEQAPYYEPTLEIVRECLAEGTRTLADLNSQIIRTISTHLGIKTQIARLSELDVTLPDTAAPGEWALLISKALGAEIYSNASGGVDLFDPELYEKAGIALEFYAPKTLIYDTGNMPFTPHLSVIDTFMWMGQPALSDFVLDL